MNNLLNTFIYMLHFLLLLLIKSGMNDLISSAFTPTSRSDQLATDKVKG